MPMLRPFARLRRFGDRMGNLGGSLVNERLNLPACIVGKSAEMAVVKTYPLSDPDFSVNIP
jgi:hypothetical protein